MAGMTRSTIRPLLVLALMLPLLGAESAQAAPDRVLVVVGAQPGKTRAAERLVRRLGGDVGQRLRIVHGFSARVPAASIARLRRAGSVRTVARDVALHLSRRVGRPGRSTRSTRRRPRSPPTSLPTTSRTRRSADAAEDAAAGSSLEPDPVASGEDAVPAVQDAVADPVAPVEPAPDDGPARARASMDLIRAAAGRERRPDRRRRRRRADRLRRARRRRRSTAPASSSAAPTSPRTPTTPTCAAWTRSATARTWPA